MEKKIKTTILVRDFIYGTINYNAKPINIKYGGLLIGREVELLIKEEDGNISASIINPIISPDEQEVIKYLDKYGLIDNSLLIPLPDTKYLLGFLLDSKFIVFIDPKFSSPIRYICEKPELWNLSKIRVCKDFSFNIKAGAPIFGVSLKKAIDICLKEKFIKALFIDTKNQKNGFYANMLASLSYSKTNNIYELECWQGVPNLPDPVYYIHALFQVNKESIIFQHFDGSVIFYTEADKLVLLSQGNKVKGYHKEKIFRLDGNINEKDVYNIIKNFMLYDEPLEDYFSISLFEKANVL